MVGAGAAGLAAAIFAAAGGAAVILVESTSDGGRKILISGGGRCNVLPAAIEPSRFVSDSPPPLVRRLLKSWPLDEQHAFFAKQLGIPLKLESDTAKYFPVSNRARDVRDALVEQAKRSGAEIRFDTRLTRLIPTDDGWRVETDRGSIGAARVVMATGGRSVPSTGSDGIGIDLLRALGHRINPTYPALTPLTAAPPIHSMLSGVSLAVRIRARWQDLSAEAHGGFLFTHRGYSGPAVLDVSHVAVRSHMAGQRAVVRVQWTRLTGADWSDLLRTRTGYVETVLARHLPSRMARVLSTEAGIPADRRAAELKRTERAALVDRLTSYELPWTGDEGFAKAEVTGGGVDLREIDTRTMESRRCRGLYLCGELLDAFGPIGGHNFAWAWATGRAAGRAAGGEVPPRLRSN